MPGRYVHILGGIPVVDCERQASLVQCQIGTGLSTNVYRHIRLGLFGQRHGERFASAFGQGNRGWLKPVRGRQHL